MDKQCDFGLIGLAVMGQNLALNVEDHGRAVAVWNLEPEWVDRFLAANPGRIFNIWEGGLAIHGGPMTLRAGVAPRLPLFEHLVLSCVIACALSIRSSTLT